MSVERMKRYLDERLSKWQEQAQRSGDSRSIELTAKLRPLYSIDASLWTIASQLERLNENLERDQ